MVPTALSSTYLDKEMERHTRLQRRLLPIVSFRLSCAVLTDELVNEIFVSLGLFGVLLQEDDGVCDAAILQKPCAQGGQLRVGGGDTDRHSEDPG